MTSCPYPSCGSNLPERAIFCPTCAKQARCIVCRDLLEPNAWACVMCGALVGDGTVADKPANADEPASAAINTFEFEETEKRRAMKARVTDTAMANLSGTIGLLMGAGARALRDRRGVTSTPPTIEHQQLGSRSRGEAPEPVVMRGE